MRGTTAIHGLRVFFLLIAVCALGTLGLWRFGSHWVGRFDQWARAEYPAHHLASVDQAKGLLAQDAKRGITALEQALEKFPKVHKGDWLFAPRQDALLELAQACQKEKQWGLATEAAATAYENDGKDLRARRLWVQCMLSTGATLDQGYWELGRLVHDFPMNQSSARQFVEMALGREDWPAAGEAGMRHYLSAAGATGGPLPTGDWLGWWTDQKNAAGFGDDRRINAQTQLEGRSLTIEFAVPRGQSAIRLDLPARSELVVELESMQAIPWGGDYELDLMGQKRRGHDLTFSGTRLESRGGTDPWMSIELPDGLVETGFMFRMTCRTDGAPGWLRQALIQPNAVEETYLLGERGRLLPVQGLREIQFKNWLRNGLKFEWKGKPEHVSLRPDSDVAGRYHFRLALDVPASGGEWVLPSALCYRWQIGGVAAMWIGGRGTLNRTCTSMSQGSPGVWTSIWGDSEYKLWLQGPDGENSVSKVTLEGWIQ